MTSSQASAGRPAGLPEIPSGAPALIIVLSAPSGAGKDTIRELLMAWDLPLHFAVTATTREKRPGEIEGHDYHFLGDAEFDQLEAEDGLLERAIVYGQRKGVPKAEVLEPLEAGKDVLVRVDVQGADTLRRLIPDALLIFIAPPSLEEARRRLEGRQTESDGELLVRIEEAASEMEAGQRFDYVVVNETGNAKAAAKRIVEIIAEEKKRRIETKAGS
jgi:guanylate kinase